MSVAGIPKTIDNDLDLIDRSFGFLTAVEVCIATLAAGCNTINTVFMSPTDGTIRERHGHTRSCQSTIDGLVRGMSLMGPIYSCAALNELGALTDFARVQEALVFRLGRDCARQATKQPSARGASVAMLNTIDELPFLSALSTGVKPRVPCHPACPCTARKCILFMWGAVRIRFRNRVYVMPTLCLW